MSGRAAGVPGDVHPAVAREELVGQLVVPEKLHQSQELLRVAGTDVGRLPYEVLRVADASYAPVYGLVAEARIDDDGPHLPSCRLQEHEAPVGHVRHVLHRGNVVRVLVQMEELPQTEMC